MNPFIGQFWKRECLEAIKIASAKVLSFFPSSQSVACRLFAFWFAFSETRLGDFWKFLATKFLVKISEIISYFLGYFEKPYSYVKSAVATSWVTFWKHLGYFLLQHLVRLLALGSIHRDRSINTERAWF